MNCCILLNAIILKSCRWFHNIYFPKIIKCSYHSIYESTQLAIINNNSCIKRKQCRIKYGRLKVTLFSLKSSYHQQQEIFIHGISKALSTVAIAKSNFNEKVSLTYPRLSILEIRTHHIILSHYSRFLKENLLLILVQLMSH